MKNRMKKLVAMALGAAMLVGANATPVYAAMDTDNTTLGGITASVAVVVKDNVDIGDIHSATASTSFSGYGGTCRATAQIYYWSNKKYYYSESTNSTAQPGGTSATATKKTGGADVVAGKGIHRVTYGDITWTPVTSVGTIPDSATKE